MIDIYMRFQASETVLKFLETIKPTKWKTKRIKYLMDEEIPPGAKWGGRAWESIDPLKPLPTGSENTERILPCWNSYSQAIPRMFENVIPLMFETVIPLMFETVILQMFETVNPRMFETVIPLMFETVILQMFETVNPRMFETVIPRMFETVIPRMFETVIPRMFEIVNPRMCYSPNVWNC